MGCEGLAESWFIQHGAADFDEGFGLYLADALAGHAEGAGDGLQGFACLIARGESGFFSELRHAEEGDGDGVFQHEFFGAVAEVLAVRFHGG